MGSWGEHAFGAEPMGGKLPRPIRLFFWIPVPEIRHGE
jgi:hypothetical protein